MSTSTITRTQFDDIALGAKVIGYATQAIGFVAASALSAACSSAIVAALVGFISFVLLGLFGELAGCLLTLKMKVAHVEAVGSATHSVMFKLGGLFARKAPAQVAA